MYPVPSEGTIVKVHLIKWKKFTEDMAKETRVLFNINSLNVTYSVNTVFSQCRHVGNYTIVNRKELHPDVGVMTYTQNY
jgi:hypothetical protein